MYMNVQITYARLYSYLYNWYSSSFFFFFFSAALPAFRCGLKRRVKGPGPAAHACRASKTKTSSAEQLARYRGQRKIPPFVGPPLEAMG